MGWHYVKLFIDDRFYKEQRKPGRLPRPFGTAEDVIRLVETPEEAHWIQGLLPPPSPDGTFEKIRKTPLFKKFSNKYLFFSPNDMPKFAYRDKSKCLICQPLRNRTYNKNHNVMVIPLNWGYYEYQLRHGDRKFIEKCRRMPKKYDFIFIGNARLPCRRWLDVLKLKKFHYEGRTKNLFQRGDKERLTAIRKFCLKIAQAKYCFAPSGGGSSSFRLYQALMVGTIPIISGHNDLPFRESVDWNNFSVQTRGNFQGLARKYSQAMKTRAIKFWEEYVYIPRLAKMLVRKLKKS